MPPLALLILALVVRACTDMVKIILQYMLRVREDLGALRVLRSSAAAARVHG